jgi:LPS-assembly lipoprotein
MIQVSTFRAALLALAVLPLSACGFTPVYGAPEQLAAAGPIAIDEIDGRAGHFLRQELLRSVGQGVPGITGSARLVVTLQLRVDRLAFAPDQAAARSDYVGDAVWSLVGADGVTLRTGKTSARASFNFADSAYADLAAQSAAQERLASSLATAIRSGLILNADKPPEEAADATPAKPLPPLPGTTSTPAVQVLQ